MANKLRVGIDGKVYLNGQEVEGVVSVKHTVETVPILTMGSKNPTHYAKGRSSTIVTLIADELTLDAQPRASEQEKKEAVERLPFYYGG